MKKLLSIAIAVAFVLVPTLVAAKKAPPAIGTVAVWNESAKEFIVKDSAGQQHIFGWNEKTKLDGTPKVGDQVTVMFKADKHGKKWATELHMGTYVAPPKK